MERARGRRRLPLVLLLALLQLLRACSGQGGGGDDDGSASAATAPMEEAERRALFAALQSFVGKGWNGSALYPDPCGWSPIQVRAGRGGSPDLQIKSSLLVLLRCCCSFLIFAIFGRQGNANPATVSRRRLPTISYVLFEQKRTKTTCFLGNPFFALCY
jgi:hypothetical protein